MWRDKAISVLSNHKFQVAAASTLSFAAGAGTAYLVLRKRMGEYYENMVEAEIEETRRFYIRASEKPELADLAKAHEEVDPDIEEIKATAAAITTKEGYTQYNKVDVKPEDPIAAEIQQVEVEASIRQNIFDNNGYDLDEELVKKEQGDPYIVEEEFFMENSAEYSTATMEYYIDDDTVADDASQALTEAEERRLLGKGNLRFGRGSSSDNTVYICNDKLQIMVEVIRVNGSFREQVLGYPSTDSLEHSDGPKIRKFRLDE